MILGFTTEPAKLTPTSTLTVGLTCAGFAWRVQDFVATATIPTIQSGEAYKSELEREEAGEIISILEGSSAQWELGL